MKNIIDMIFWKLSAAVLWSVAFEAGLLILLLCVDINILKPFTWLDALSTAISFRVWISFLPLAVLTAAQGILCGKKYLMAPKYSRTRFQSFRKLISLHNIAMALLCPLMNLTVVWAFLTAVGKEHLKVEGSCEKPQNCVSEGYVYLCLGALWSGMYYFLAHYIWDLNNPIFPVQFPVVQQPKSVQLESVLLPSFTKSVYKAITPNLYFLVLFYWKSETMYNFLDLSVERSGLSFQLILHAWLFTTIFIFTIVITRFSLQVHLTEHCEFPIMVKSGSCVKLSEILSMKHKPFVQALGCFDLKVVATRDFCRRRELFDLSQPGGHPHSWNTTIKEILNLIENFTSDLTAATYDTSDFNEPRFDVSEVPPAPVHRSLSPTIRNLSVPRDHQSFLQTSTLQTSKSMYDSIADVTKKSAVLFVDSLMQKPGARFVFGDVPEAKVRYVLSQSLPVIWTIQGVSGLVTRAFTEDTYGVVVKDLSAILTSIVNLKLVLDKIPKLGSNKRCQRSDQDEMKMKNALRAAVTQSLYSICLVYGESIMQLEVSKNVRLQLWLFLSYNEE